MSVLRKGSAFIRRFPFVPGVIAVTTGAIFLLVAMRQPEVDLLLEAGFTCAAAAFIWGYSRRALKHHLWPPLSYLERRSYGQVWDSIAISREAAAVAVSGQTSEADLRTSAQATTRNLLELVAITEHDEVLEIGCGVARIGRELAPYCRHWTGADVSGNLLAYAKERIAGVANASVIQLYEPNLAEIPDASVDVVYSSNVFPHLDEVDRWKYVQEAFRVLRSGGRLFIDNIDLESDAGWAMFANDAARFESLERPPYMPRYSTAPELITYAVRAGFAKVRDRHRSPLVIVTAVKP